MKLESCVLFNSLPKDKILDLSKLKECADNDFKFDENNRKFSKQVEMSNFSFSQSVCNGLVL